MHDDWHGFVERRLERLDDGTLDCKRLAAMNAENLLKLADLVHRQGEVLFSLAQRGRRQAAVLLVLFVVLLAVSVLQLVATWPA